MVPKPASVKRPASKVTKAASTVQKTLKENPDIKSNGSQPGKRKAVTATNVDRKKSVTSKKQKVVCDIPEICAVVGKVFVCGDNSVGQLGFNEDIMEKKRPAVLEMPYDVVDIEAGGMHSVCLTQTGEVITFGCNDEGALGRKTTEGSEYIPRKVDIPERIVKITAGDSHTAALSESGQVYIWGNFRNNDGNMGLVTPYTNQPFPVKILNNEKIVQIASGENHLVCLSNMGLIFTCGDGQLGQLGRIAERLSKDGGRKGMNHLLCPQVVPLGGGYVIDIWTGTLSTFMKFRDGSIKTFGLNNFGQLGTNPEERIIWRPKKIISFQNRNWVQINGGQHHTLGLDNEGHVYSLGRSEYGRLGLGEDAKDVNQPTVIPSLVQRKCIHVNCGNCESFALEENGSVFSWGFGTNYQLGHGNDDDQHIPKLIEGNFYNLWKALKISGGGQHTLILAHPRNTSKETQ